jgi:quinolinate synthase
LRKLRARHPDAKVLVHPESPLDVIAQADVVGSTTALVEAARKLPAKKFIVATDNGSVPQDEAGGAGQNFPGSA